MKDKQTSMQNILRKILEKDQEGREAVRQAEEEAQHIIEEAEKQKQATIEQAQEEAQKEAEEILENARQSAEDELSQESVNAAGIAMNKEQFQRSAEKNMDEAVDVLVRWVLGEEDIS